MLGIELPPEEPKDFGFHLQTQRKGIWQAAFEQENEIVSWLSRSQGDYNIPEEGFNSWEELRRIGREQDFESVVGARNRTTFNAALQNIDRERENKRILDAAPWWQSTLAQIVAGTLSPTMLLPGGGAVKSVKGGFSIAKSALLTGSWAGMGVAAQEAALQATQQNRTIAEGAINVAGGVLLGGLLGAGAAGVLTRAERKILEQKVLPPLYGASGEQIDKAVIRATDLTELKADLNKAKSDWVMSPRAVMDPDGRLELVAAVARLTPDVALGVKAHGTSSVDDLVRILDKGPDPERQFFTGDLGGQGQGVSAKVSNDFLVIMDKETGKTPVAVAVADKMEGAVARLQESFPEIDFVRPAELEEFLARGLKTAEEVQANKESFEVPEVKVPADFGNDNIQGMAAVGAEVARSSVTRADYAPKLKKGWLTGARFIPVLRLAQNPIEAIRKVAQQLTPSNLRTGMHEKGIAASAGGAVETDMERIYNSSYGRGLKHHKEQYLEHKKAGGTLTPQQFDWAVDMAARFDDKHSDPYVTAAAEGWRKYVANPLLKMAQDVGGLPAELAALDINERITYMHRSFNRDIIVRNRPVLEERLFPHAQKMIIDGKNASKEKLDAQIKAAEEEIYLLSLDRAGKEAELKSIEDTIEQINMYYPEEYRLAQKLEEARASLKQPGLTPDVKTQIKQDIEVLKGQLKDTDYYAMMANYKTKRRMLSQSRGAMEEKIDKVIESLGDLYEKQTRELNRLIKKGQDLQTVINKNKPEVWAQKRAELKQMFEEHRVMYHKSAKDMQDKIWELDYEQQKMEAKIWERTDEASVSSNFAALQEQQKASKEELEKFKKKAGPLKKQLEREMKRQEALASKMDRIQDRIDEADWYDNHEAMRVFKEAAQELQETVASNQMMRGMRAQRMIERLEKYGPPEERIKMLRDKIEAKKLRYEDRWDYKGFDANQLAKEIVDDYIDTIIGLNNQLSDENPLLVPIKKVGPLKGRVGWVPEEELIKEIPGENGRHFLNMEAPLTWNHYARLMAGDIALRRQFGKITMEDQLAEIDRKRAELVKQVDAAQTVEEVERLTGEEFKKWTWTGKKKQDLEATKKDARSFIDEQHHSGRGDLEALRDMVLGRYKVAENNSTFGQIVRAVNLYNYGRLMGGATIASLNDLYRPAMVHGLKPYLSEVVQPLLKSAEAWARATDELEAAGTAMEYTLLHRTMNMFEIGDPMARGTGVDRAMSTLASVASKWNGLALFTQWGQKFAGVMTMNELVKHAGTGNKTEWFRFLNINAGQEARIAKYWKQYGEVVDGVRVPNTERWTEGLAGEELRQAEDAVRAFRNAVKQEVDSIIVAPGFGDAPLFSKSPLGKAIFQFMSFNMSAHQKVFMRGLQEGDARLVSTVASMVTIGMGIAAIQAWRNGETSWEKFKQSAQNPGFLIGEGLDKSGLMPMLFDLGNRAQTLGRSMGVDFNPIKTPLLYPFPGDSQAGDQSRFGVTQGAWSFLGPSANLVFGEIPKAGAAVVKAATGDDLSQSEKKALIRPLPYWTMPGAKEFLTRFAIGDN